MLDTKYVGDNYKMLVTAILVTNIQKMTPKWKFDHQYHCRHITFKVIQSDIVARDEIFNQKF